MTDNLPDREALARVIASVVWGVTEPPTDHPGEGGES